MKLGLLVVMVAGLSFAGPAPAATLFVDTTANTNTRDSDLSLLEAFLVLSPLPGTLNFADLTLQEKAQISGAFGVDDRITFQISGGGIKYIESPPVQDWGGLGVASSAYPPIQTDNLLIDGYTVQSGCSPNSNDILSGNNASLRIVLDSRNLVGGTGDSCVLLVGASGVAIQGVAMLGNLSQSTPDTIYGVYVTELAGKKAKEFHLRGCWMGLAPDGSGGLIHAGFAYAVLEYLSDGGMVIGTDGDNVDDTTDNLFAGDRTEFNVFGANEVAILTEDVNLAATTRISGNYIAVMPDGLSSLPAGAIAQLRTTSDAIESALSHNITIGTNSDGISDENERNIIGFASDDFYEDYSYDDVYPENIVIAGNYIGVGVDGTSKINDGISNFIKEPATPFRGLRIGSNLDGVRDDVEANLIANVSNYLLVYTTHAEPLSAEERNVSLRGNSLFGNAPTLGLFIDPQFSRSGLVLGSGAVTPTLAVASPGNVEVTVNAPLHTGNGGAAVSGLVIDLYVADAGTLPAHPQGRTYVTSVADNGPDDLDAGAGAVRFDPTAALVLAGFGGQTVPLTVTANVLGGVGPDTSPFAAAQSASVPTVASIASWSAYD